MLSPALPRRGLISFWAILVQDWSKTLSDHQTFSQLYRSLPCFFLIHGLWRCLMLSLQFFATAPSFLLIFPFFPTCFPSLPFSLQFLPTFVFHVLHKLYRTSDQVIAPLSFPVLASSQLPGHRDGQITDFSRFTSATAALAPCTEPQERQNGLNETWLRPSRLWERGFTINKWWLTRSLMGFKRSEMLI